EANGPRRRGRLGHLEVADVLVECVRPLLAGVLAGGRIAAEARSHGVAKLLQLPLQLVLVEAQASSSNTIRRLRSSHGSRPGSKSRPARRKSMSTALIGMVTVMASRLTSMRAGAIS